MNANTYSKEGVRTDMIEEALALLRIIDAEQGNEDINEGRKASEMRLLLRARSRELVAKIIGDLQAPANGETPAPFFAAAA